MEKHQLIEKKAKEAGLGDVKVEWKTFSGGNIMNDSLLAGSLDYATTGIPGSRAAIMPSSISAKKAPRV